MVPETHTWRGGHGICTFEWLKKENECKLLEEEQIADLISCECIGGVKI